MPVANVFSTTGGAVGGGQPLASTTWRLLWSFQPALLADHDFVASALTVSGVEVRNGSEGAVTTCAISGGVMTVDTISAGAIGGLWIYPVQALATSMQRRICITAGLGANLTADGDGVFLQYSNFGGTIFGGVEANRSAGAQRMSVFRAGGVIGHKATTAGAQARVIGAEWAPGRQSFRPLWSPTAWSGAGPNPDSMTPVALTPSGWHVATDVTPGETADDIPADNAVGSNPVELVLKVRPANGRAYTLPGWSLWVEM